MKRIEFIAPIDSMRGNLGGKQSLVYAPNDNRAFESIDGQLNPALNYEPRLIAAKGKRRYFCVKTKSTCHLTPRYKNTMANLGGVGAVYSALVRNKSSQLYQNAYGCYLDEKAAGYDGTFRKYMYGFIKSALDAKNANIDISTANHRVVIDNPFVKTGVSNITINSASLIKFWPILANNPVIKNIDGVSTPIICHKNDTFGDVIGSSYNVLSLRVDSQDSLIAYGDLIVCEDGRGTPMNESNTVDTYNGYILLEF